jgi:hypothetical protein
MSTEARWFKVGDGFLVRRNRGLRPARVVRSGRAVDVTLTSYDPADFAGYVWLRGGEWTRHPQPLFASDIAAEIPS